MKAPLPPNEAQRLESLRSYDVLDTPPEPAFDDLTLLAAQICRVPIAVITLVDENRQWFKSIIGLNATETPRDLAFCAHAILHSDEVLEVRDAQLDPRFADNPLVTADPHIRFYVGSPLVSPDGSALGTLCVIDRVPRELSAEQKTAMRALSRIVIMQLELRRTLAAHRQTEEQLKSLNVSLEQKVEERTAELRQEMEVRLESEQQFRQLSENIHEVFWMTDPAKEKVLYVSPAYEQIWGRTLQSLADSPQSWLEAIHVEDRQRVLQATQTRQMAGLYDEEYRIVRPNGDIRWIRDRAFPVRDSGGAVHRIVGVADDITVRKNYESQIVENEGRLLDILNVSPIGVRIAVKQGGEVVFYNPRYADLIKNINAKGDDPRKYYVRVEDYEEVLAELAHGNSVINRQIELRTPDGSTAWTLASYMPMQYQGEDAVLGWFFDITQRMAAEEEIKRLAFYDTLTELPNRRLLMDRLRQALASSARSGRAGALLFIDLDNFKNLNDTLGHDIGDLLLQQVAQRLESCIREGDTVARLGGDEFVVMLADLSKDALEAAAQTEPIGEKIIATLSQPYRLALYEYHGTPSIGAILFNGHQSSIEELMKQADIAMYQAKKAGRNTLRFFDPQMQASISARAALESELHKALEKQQFHLHYQIQMDSSLRPLGAEALIRWLHPERGLVSPAQFIPLAEETGLILPIGQWVLETACAQIKAWQHDVLSRDLVLAVNVSARQFHQADFVAQVQAAVQRHAINPKLLKLELTESLLLEDIDDTIETMSALNQIGVQFSLDDFGTGYSSLQYLKRLPLDQIKIDQSFVRYIAIDSSDMSIVSTIIAMARSLNLDVIAEGVETEEQRQLLLKNGCTHFQGYLFGRPVPIEQFEASLKQG